MLKEEMMIIDGTYEIKDFDELDRTLDVNGAGKYVLIQMGIMAHQVLEDVLVKCFQNTNINYLKEGQNQMSELLGAALNLKYMVKSDRVFMFKRIKTIMANEMKISYLVKNADMIKKYQQEELQVGLNGYLESFLENNNLGPATIKVSKGKIIIELVNN